jgi:CMP/dCMP kinase
MSDKVTITIARRMGSGGSYVGRLLAKRLGLKYVDREVLHIAARTLGIEESALEPDCERVASFWEKLLGAFTFGPPDNSYTPPPVRNYTDKQLFECQTEILRQIAAREDCCIVGWGGAYVLPRHARMVNFYFHAPISYRVRRVMEIYKLDDKTRARRMIEESDQTRERYFREMIHRDWSCADNYHLCVDTSMRPLQELAEKLAGFIERRVGAKQPA